MNMTKPKSKHPDTIPVTELESKRTSLISARDQLRLQLNGVENQIYIIDQLLNPEPAPTPPPPDKPGTI